ncbi:hypothetical protein A4A49_38442 [Nicotiana attenuata]|uniref:Retrovirus-related pol polyprotein from transposon tnt 1-94 n=1 Tax=Nicotiana attenuata TaxID=49451 RepID=A0A1J6K5D6_NICAT|nr:hypothetical protein A4A49_38442 [Nicotiana attenuata]
MTKDGNTTRVVNADNTASTITIVQFNPASQLPIKLSGSHNFATWKAQFSMLIHGHDLYGHLDGSTPAPIPSTTFGTNTTPNPAYTLWFRQDQLIQNALMASVDPTIASTVAAANTSKQAWDSLHTAYANKSQTRIFSLRDQLGRITKDTTPITEYLQRIRSLSDELATAGAPVTNSELIVKILSGLGHEFREISAAIRARDTIVTYEELYEKLLDHELFLRHEEAKKTPGPITAAVATHNKSNNNSNNRNNRRQYYYYNNNNTNNSQPWRQNARPNNASQYHPPNNNTTIVIRCQLCNKFGHVASVCQSKSHNHFEAKANNITGFNTTANPWIVDSGATHHITTEPHNLQLYHGNKDVSMGDGSESVNTAGVQPEETWTV